MEEERDRRLLSSDRTAGISRKLLKNIIKTGCQAEKQHANVSHLKNKPPSQGGPVTNGNTESLNADRYSSATVPDLHRKHKKMIRSKPKKKKNADPATGQLGRHAALACSTGRNYHDHSPQLAGATLESGLCVNVCTL